MISAGCETDDAGAGAPVRPAEANVSPHVMQPKAL